MVRAIKLRSLEGTRIKICVIFHSITLEVDVLLEHIFDCLHILDAQSVIITHLHQLLSDIPLVINTLH